MNGFSQRGLIKGIQSGQLSLVAFRNRLAEYIRQRNELIHRERLLEREVFISKMNDVNMAIEFTEIFIDNYSKIRQSGS